MKQHLSDTQQFTQLLSQTLYRAACPSAEILNQFHINELPSKQAQAVEAHLAGCPHCSAELANLQTFLATFPEPTSVEKLPVWQRIKTVIANQLPPIRMPAPGLKADASDSTSQYIYLVEVEAAIPITVEVEADPEQRGQYRLIGQSALQSADSHTAILWREGNAEPIASQTVSELGEFQFTAIETGKYEIILSNEQTDVCLRDIVV